MITFLAIASLCFTFWAYLTKMLAILNPFYNLVFYLSLLRMLFLASNFVYQSCRELATLHQKVTASTSGGISTGSQTPNTSKPHPTPPSLKPHPPSIRNTNPPSTQLIIEKYPHQQLKEAKNKFHELGEKNCDFEETNSWCQCSCVIS